jgi:phosphoribosylglycinamide formyltransferase-1
MSLRFAVLISGRGSSVLASSARPGTVASTAGSSPSSATARMHRASRPPRRSDSKGRSSRARGEDREAFGLRLSERIRERGAELVVLAGFMRILSGGFVREWQGRLLNIHPSLLPAFRGLHTHRRVLEAGEPVHGCTVHFVVEELDAGPAVIQGRLALRPGGRKHAFSAFSVWNTLISAGSRLVRSRAARAALLDGRAGTRDRRGRFLKHWHSACSC